MTWCFRYEEYIEYINVYVRRLQSVRFFPPQLNHISSEKRRKAGKEEVIFGTGPLWMLRLTGVYASLWWFQQAKLRLTPSWERFPIWQCHCFPHRLKPPASIFSLCLCHVYPKGNLKVDEFLDHQPVGRFICCTVKNGYLFGPSIVYSSIRVDQIWLWDFEVWGWFLTQIKSSIQSRIKRISALKLPQFRRGALNVCRLVDDEERRMTIEALKQRKVEARWFPMTSSCLWLSRLIGWITRMWVPRFWWAAVLLFGTVLVGNPKWLMMMVKFTSEF